MTSLNPPDPLPSSKRTTPIVRGRRVGRVFFVSGRTLKRIIGWSIVASPILVGFYFSAVITLLVFGFVSAVIVFVSAIVWLVNEYDE